MSKPGEHGFTWDNDDAQTGTDDVLRVGEKTQVAKDDRTIKDDLQDYIFMNPRRKKKHSGKSSSHKSRRKKRKMKTWKKVLISIACVLMSLVLIMVGTVVFLVFKGQNELIGGEIQITAPDTLDASLQEGGKYVVYNGETYKLNENITSMLFMGVDKRDMDDLGEMGANGQADVIVLLAIDFNNRKLTLINVPRDTMTDVSIYSTAGYYTGMQRQQICLSYAYGDGKESSCENTVTSVRRVFYNIPVNTYFSLDLDGISAINDIVGGVDVVSPETIEQFTKGQQYHLQGMQAERFVRARVHDRAEANILRMERQQIYAKGFMEKVMSEVKENPSTAVSLFNESSPYSCTSLNASRVMYMAQDIAMHGSLNAEFITVPGKSTLNENEYAEFNISEKEFYEQFLSVFYEKI